MPGEVAIYSEFSQSWEFIMTLEGETNEWDSVTAYSCEVADCLEHPFFTNPFIACNSIPEQVAWYKSAWLSIIPPLSLDVKELVPNRFTQDGVLTVRVLFQRSLDKENSTCLAREYDIAFTLPVRNIPISSFETDGPLCPGMSAPEGGRLVRGDFNTTCLWQCLPGDIRRPWNAVPLKESTLACMKFPKQFSALLISVDLLVPMWWTRQSLGADFFSRVDDLSSLMEQYLIPVLTFPSVDCVLSGTRHDSPTLQDSIQEYVGKENRAGYSYELMTNNETMLRGALPQAGTFRMECRVLCNDLLLQPSALTLIFTKTFDTMLLLESLDTRLKITKVGQFDVDHIIRYARTEPFEGGDAGTPMWRVAMTAVEVLCAGVILMLLGPHMVPWS